MKALTKIEEKEVAGVLALAMELQVHTFEQCMDAADALFDIKTVGEKITQRKEEITKPMNESLKSARAFFKPFETQYSEAEQIVKTKVLDYHAAHWAEQTMPDNTIHGLKGKVTVVEKEKVEITDEDSVPREFCVPDAEKVKHYLLSGKKLKGAQLVRDYTIMAGKN